MMITDASYLQSLGVTITARPVLASWTTFRLGGPCPALYFCATPQQLTATVNFLVKNKTPFLLIGGGSNLVVCDEGIDQAVIRYVSDTPIIERSGEVIHVSASTSLDQLALYCAQSGLQGLHTTHGIPGTVGGAIVGNAGAFGKQVGDVLESVTLISALGDVREVPAAQLGFSYRNSKLKESGDIVVSAQFRLTQTQPQTLLAQREDILKIRAEKHPDLTRYPCAGSFFRNIEPTSKAEKRQAAGWFLEQAGGKSLCVGGAKIFDKHANIIVKGQDCTALDVYLLSKEMQKLVKSTFGFELTREVLFVGFLPGVEESTQKIIW